MSSIVISSPDTSGQSAAQISVQWADRRLAILDQTLLPISVHEIILNDVEAVWEAIRSLRVRGAPAIGITAAYGVLVHLFATAPQTVADGVARALEAADFLATSRPTAVNLFWSLDRMRNVALAASGASDLASFLDALEREAIAIHDEDRRLCRAIGEHGAKLIPDGGGVLTHCNAGGLATSEYGTALAVMFSAHEQGRKFRVFADETRPLLQGARLTMWELTNAGIPCTLICDNTAAQVMREGKVDLVVVGADRIAANGDTANKIGTYSVAVLAHAHKIPFYVAAPYSTFDFGIASGAEIPIELRDSSEVTHAFGRSTAPEGVDVYSPAFDITPAELISGIITERGILGPGYTESIAQMRASLEN